MQLILPLPRIPVSNSRSQCNFQIYFRFPYQCRSIQAQCGLWTDVRLKIMKLLLHSVVVGWSYLSRLCTLSDS